MFHHAGFITRDAKRALAFYEAITVPLGLGIPERHPNGAFIITGAGAEFLYIGPDAPTFWDGDHEAGKSPVHLCFAAPSKEAVDRFHADGLGAGGKDNGGPGLRDAHYYAAYLLDPDGNNIEAVFESK